MVGYEVRKKGLHYYRYLKCKGMSLTAFGSSRKKNAEQLLKDLLNNFRIPHPLFPLIHLQLEKIFDHFNPGNAEADKMLIPKGIVFDAKKYEYLITDSNRFLSLVV